MIRYNTKKNTAEDFECFDLYCQGMFISVNINFLKIYGQEYSSLYNDVMRL